MVTLGRPVVARAATHHDVNILRLPAEEPETGPLEGTHPGQRRESDGIQHRDPHQLLTGQHVVVGGRRSVHLLAAIGAPTCARTTRP